MANPIKHSDLVQDDGAIEKMIKDLEALAVQMGESKKRIVRDAASVEASLAGITGVTEEQREVIREAAKKTDDLGKAYKSLDKALNENKATIEEVRETTKTVNALKRLEAKLNNNVEGSYNALSAEMSILKLRYKQLTKEQQTNTKEGKELTARINAINDELKEMDKAVGVTSRNVGNYTDSIREALGEIGQLPGALGAGAAGVKSLGAQFKALVRNPVVLVIGLIVAGLGALLSAFTRTEKGAKILTVATGVMEGAMSLLVDIANRVAESISNFVNDPLKAVKDLGRAIKENIVNRIQAAAVLIGKFGQALTRLAVGDIAGAKQALDGVGDAAIQLATGLDAAKRFNIMEALNEAAKKAKETTNAFVALKLAQKENEKINASLSASAARLNSQMEIQQQIADDTTLSFRQQKEALIEAQKAAEGKAQIEIQIARNNLSLITRELNLRRANGEETTALFQQQATAMMDLQQAQTALTLATANAAKQRREITRDEFERELDFAVDFYDAQKTQLEKQIGDESKTVSERVAILQRLVELDASAFSEQIKLLEGFTEQRLNLNELALEDDERVVRERLRQYDLDDVTLGRILEVLRERKMATQDITEAERDLLAQRREDIGTLPALLPSVDIFGKQTEQQIINDAKIKLIDMKEEIRKQARREANRADGFQLLDIFNLGDDERANVQSSLDFAKQQLASFTQAIQQAADARVQASDRAVAAAENELNRQIELQAAGQANTAATARQELAQAQENQKKALDQQRRAQRQQVAIQSIEQASNLITGISKLFVTPGFPAALPLVALMIGSFAAAKIAALTATRRTEFAKGGYEFIGGGTHATGRDTPLGFSSKGRPAYAQAGEFVGIVNHQQTAKYKSILPALIDSLNAGTFEEKFGRMSAAGRQLPIVNVNAAGTDTATMESYLAQMVKNGGQQVIPNGQGGYIVKRGRWTTVKR